MRKTQLDETSNGNFMKLLSVANLVSELCEDEHKVNDFSTNPCVDSVSYAWCLNMITHKTLREICEDLLKLRAEKNEEQ